VQKLHKSKTCLKKVMTLKNVHVQVHNYKNYGKIRCHDSKPNDTKPNDSAKKTPSIKALSTLTTNIMPSGVYAGSCFLCCYAECHYAECQNVVAPKVTPKLNDGY
jgi:hypothetical protein